MRRSGPSLQMLQGGRWGGVVRQGRGHFEPAGRLLLAVWSCRTRIRCHTPRSLPADLVACVLAHLPLPFKLRAAAVCSEWRVGAGTPHLYAVLDRAQLARQLV